MLLSEVYRNATNNFEQDPQLRELLMNTFNKAEQSQPFSVENLAEQPVGGAKPTYMSNILSPQAQPAVPNRAAKTGQELTARSEPITPEYLANMDMANRGGIAPIAPGQPVSPQIRGSATPQNLPQLPQQSELAAFLSGLGSSNALLPALGGGMQAVQDLKAQQASRNNTMRALINRGLDPDTAAAAVTNPEILKQILPRLFGGQFGGKVKLGTVTNEGGQEQSVFYDEYGNIQPIGGPKPSAYEKGLQKQSLDTIKKYREAANQAQTTLAQLNQLRRARQNVGYEGIPFADVWARIMGLYGEGGGEDIRSTAANIQLQFTQQTKGAISDREMSLFALATPGLQMSDPGADRVITAMEAASRRTIERNKFFQQWSRLNRGDLTGADEAWDRYVNENQIISQDNQGNLSVDKSKLSNWASYLPGGSRGIGSNAGAQYSPASYRQPVQQNTQGNQLTPHDFGEAVPGMYQDERGRWVAPDPNTGELQIWEPPT